MRADRFDRLMADFSEEFGPRVGERPEAPGRWLESFLGIGPICVAIGYQDGYWARRFLSRFDARSAEEATEWNRRYRRAWLEANLQLVDSRPSATYRRHVAARLKEAKTTRQDPRDEDDLWYNVIDSYEWATVGPWGPGRPVSSDRLERLQLLFLVARVVEMTRGKHAAFAYLVGSDPFLATAPAMGIRLGGRQVAQDVIASVYRHVVEMGVPFVESEEQQ